MRLLITRGGAVDTRDGDGRTPLMLAVRACVDSYWTHRRAPDSVRALLAAAHRRTAPGTRSGYDEVDVLLAGKNQASAARAAQAPQGE